MAHSNDAYDAALQVIQQAVTVLVKWAAPELAEKFSTSKEKEAVRQAKTFFSWSGDRNPKPLQLLFDLVKLSQGQNQRYYLQPTEIADRHPSIPYPRAEKPVTNDFSKLKQKLQEALTQLESDDWKNLSLLTLILEKFGSFISFYKSDVSFVDMAKSTAAIAAAITNNQGNKKLSLVAGDLSGIQNFIYTISSNGALKSLRARSFYLELVTEEVVQQLLEALKLPRTSVIYTGGGKFYLLAAEGVNQTVEQVCQQFNEWLLGEFQGKVFLSADCLTFPIEEIATVKFAKHWSDVTQKLSQLKFRKFAKQINNVIKPRESHEPCRVCHRDDVEILKPLNNKDPDSVDACETCCRMFDLGRQLLRVEAIVRSQRENTERKPHTLSFKLPATAQRPAVNVDYHLFSTWKPIVLDSDTVLLVNDWTVEHYQFRHFRKPVPLLLGNYARESEDEPGSIMRAEEIARKAKGIARVGYLRMDVDRLGRIFAQGLKEKTLPRISGLSRKMSYFFKVYLNSLAENRLENLPKQNEKIKTLTLEPRQNLLFIYAGGDDLFISGAWNEVVEFAFDVYQCFRAYTGYNPDITLSGGISIADPKFPLYQAAEESGDAEGAAKGNGKDSLGLFNQVFKWDEWLGAENIKVSNIAVLDEETKRYLDSNIELDLFGILPLVKKLNEQHIEVNYARSFIRNLLDTAQVQDQLIKEIEDKRKQQYENQHKDIRYYLHLPKIAYTLAKLPENVSNNSNFLPIRRSLMNPCNAPYFRSVATWIELLNRTKKYDTTQTKPTR
ncbi:hypothetical protein NUACC21_64350 [Scytonema sp. NUACC21]